MILTLNNSGNIIYLDTGLMAFVFADGGSTYITLNTEPIEAVRIDPALAGLVFDTSGLYGTQTISVDESYSDIRTAVTGYGFAQFSHDAYTNVCVNCAAVHRMLSVGGNALMKFRRGTEVQTTTAIATAVTEIENALAMSGGSGITQLTGEATAGPGSGSQAVTLSTTAVTGKPLTGLSISGSAVVSTDTILQAFGKLQNQVNAVAGGVNYQGTWNANTNSPALASSVGTKGYYYVVSVAGSTNLNGITDWKLGDWAIFNGSTWEKVDNTDAVISVNGYTGIVTLAAADVGAPSGSGTSTGTNTGDQTSIVGISGTKAQFDTACSDGNFLYTGDAVPYTGATSALNLGSQNFQTTGLVAIGEAPTAGIQLEISSNTSTDVNIEASLHHDSIFSGVMLLRKSRGTHASPTSLNSADRLGFIGFSGYAGSVYFTPAAIIATAEEAFATGQYGTAINFETATTGGSSPARTNRMKIHPSGNVSIGSSLTNNGFRLEVTGNSRILGSSTSSGNALIVGDSAAAALHTFPNVGGQQSRAIATPATPSAGDATIFIDSTAKILAIKDDAGVYKAQSANAAIASQGAGFATDTYVTNSDLIIPSWGLQAKTTFLWAISASKTNAGTQTPIYNIRIGANRTTGDTARLTLTGPAQTAVADIGTLWVMVTVRSVGAGSAAVLQGTAWWNHQGTAANTTTQGTGFANNGTGHVQATSAGFDSTGMAGQYIGLSINGGTSASWTITQVKVDANW